MAPRLLSLLTLIEAALNELEQGGATSRLVNYRRGVARMTFVDGRGGVVVQNFALADGQLCVRVELHRGGVLAGEAVFYPRQTAFDWADEAATIARRWASLPLEMARTGPVDNRGTPEPALA